MLFFLRTGWLLVDWFAYLLRNERSSFLDMKSLLRIIIELNGFDDDDNDNDKLTSEGVISLTLDLSWNRQFSFLVLFSDAVHIHAGQA